MKVAIIQLGYADGSEESVEARAERAAGLVARAGAGHDLVLLPELWSAGGFASKEWEERSQDLSGLAEGHLPPALVPVAEATKEIGAVVHTGSHVERTAEPGEEGRHLWNTSVVLDPRGSVCATYRKIHRFGFGGGEPRLMEAGTEIVVTELPAPADGVHIGLSTCYDLRFPELYRLQLDRGAGLFLIPSAWPMARVEHWRLLLRARAIENQAFVVAGNTAGTHAGVEMGGRSAVVDPSGTVLAEAGAGEETMSVEIDLDEVARVREGFPVLSDRRL